ncbi:MAG: ABC transporter permease [Clostridiales bacterium]|nr:ABC transporter permease [Clostridiales bacterium]
MILRLKLLLRDKVFLVTALLMPLLLAYAAGAADETSLKTGIPVSVVDMDRSAYSKLLVARLSSNEALAIFLSNQANLSKQADFSDQADLDTALEMLEGSKVEAVFIIEKGFMEAITDGQSEGLIKALTLSGSFAFPYAEEAVAVEVMRFTSARQAAGIVSGIYKDAGLAVDESLRSKVMEYSESIMKEGQLLRVIYTEIVIDYQLQEGVDKSYNQDYQNTRYSNRMQDDQITPERLILPSLHGILLVFLMLSTLYSGSWLIEERNTGTLSRLISSGRGIKLAFLTTGVMLFLVALVQTAIFHFGTLIFFGTPVLNNLIELAILIIYIIFIVALSLFFSTLFNDQSAMQTASTMVAVFSGIISGSLFDLREVSGTIRMLSLFTPQGWALSAISGSSDFSPFMGNNAMLISSNSLPAIAVLLIFSLLLFTSGYIIIKRKLR